MMVSVQIVVFWVLLTVLPWKWMLVFGRYVFHLQVQSYFHSESGGDVFLQILVLTMSAEGHNLDILIFWVE